MDTKSDFERDVADRLAKVESALMALSERVDGIAADRGYWPSSPRSRETSTQATDWPPALQPRPRVRIPTGMPDRGADWWLARAGAALTVVAVILLYQYAVGHGWITPIIRVLIGAAVGAGLIYWGGKQAPSSATDASPVALRELMMGAGLAAWFITAFAASSRYHLVSAGGSRYLFLLLSVVGGALSLKERRSGLALIAVTAGFIGPMILSDGTAPSVGSYAFYLTTLGALSVVLYLMRGWQSVLWISFSGAILSLSGPWFLSTGIVLTILAVAFTLAYTRAPSMRRELVATGSDRYTEPVRSKFASHWLSETGRFFNAFSPAAGALDSISLWIITLAAPVVGVFLISRAWPAVNDGIWGAMEIAMAFAAFRYCSTRNDESSEITHLAGVACLVWGTFGAVDIGHGIVPATVVDHDTMSLAIASIAAIAGVVMAKGSRTIALQRVAMLISAISVVMALFIEASLTNSQFIVGGDRLKLATTLAEILAIAAGVIAWREMKRQSLLGEPANVLIFGTYAAALLVDARVLGELWRPLVTATFAIAGTTLLLMSRKEENKLLRAVAAATLLLVVVRLFFVDMAGVDTLWRVLLFLGVGALFLFTSRRMQPGREQPAPEST